MGAPRPVLEWTRAPGSIFPRAGTLSGVGGQGCQRGRQISHWKSVLSFRWQKVGGGNAMGLGVTHGSGPGVGGADEDYCVLNLQERDLELEMGDDYILDLQSKDSKIGSLRC